MRGRWGQPWALAFIMRGGCSAGMRGAKMVAPAVPYCLWARKGASGQQRLLKALEAAAAGLGVLLTSPASSPGWGQSCQTWAVWLGPRSCRSSSACRCGERCPGEWWAVDLPGRPGNEAEVAGGGRSPLEKLRGAGWQPESPLTFMPISMLERSANGTSRVTSSHNSTAKLHISAERRLISSAFF